jgi:hypothetical protein
MSHEHQEEEEGEDEEEEGSRWGLPSSSSQVWREIFGNLKKPCCKKIKKEGQERIFCILKFILIHGICLSFNIDRSNPRRARFFKKGKKL